MSHPENEDSGEPVPLHGQVRHSHLSARVPEAVGRGVFANGVMILTGAYEIVLDFVLRFGEPNRIVARVILPHVVARQLIAVLQENLQAFETRFGPVPRLPRVRPMPEETQPANPAPEAEAPDPTQPSFVQPQHPENLPHSPAQPQIEDIYDELRLPDGMLSGSYANAVLVRHTGTEFCFDFITNIFPRSAVSSRVYLAAPHVPLLLQSLIRSLNPGPPRG
jgi:DNA segregation ATPase FtsK/SpoIIIE-like protein